MTKASLYGESKLSQTSSHPEANCVYLPSASHSQAYCVKSVGKAAAAGLALPVAVGLEVLAVPGAGW